MKDMPHEKRRIIVEFRFYDNHRLASFPPRGFSPLNPPLLSTIWGPTRHNISDFRDLLRNPDPDDSAAALPR